MNDNENRQYRHAKRTADVYLNEEEDITPTVKSKARRTSAKNVKKKKTKKKYKFKLIHIIPIVFVICCLGFAYYIYSSTKTDGPVYGDRCSNVIALDTAKIEEAKSLIMQDGNIESLTIEVSCKTVKMDFKFISGVSVEDAKNIAVNATHQLDNTLGYDKNSEEDAYSKIFSTDGETRQYDLELTLYGDQDGYPVFGTKQFKNNEITFTDALVKDQSIVDSIQSQGEEE